MYAKRKNCWIKLTSAWKLTERYSKQRIDSTKKFTTCRLIKAKHSASGWSAPHNVLFFYFYDEVRQAEQVMVTKVTRVGTHPMYNCCLKRTPFVDMRAFPKSSNIFISRRSEQARSTGKKEIPAEATVLCCTLHIRKYRKTMVALTRTLRGQESFATYLLCYLLFVSVA